MIDDQWTLQLETLLLEIARAAVEHGKRYYIGGGFALDCFLGRLTRPHEDLDFFPLEADTAWWRQWFTENDYVLG